MRGYFAAGCKTLKAAQALGVGADRVREVKRKPGAPEYLRAIEERALDVMVQARASQLLAPLILPR